MLMWDPRSGTLLNRGPPEGAPTLRCWRRRRRPAAPAPSLAAGALAARAARPCHAVTRAALAWGRAGRAGAAGALGRLTPGSEPAGAPCLRRAPGTPPAATAGGTAGQHDPVAIAQRR